MSENDTTSGDSIDANVMRRLAPSAASSRPGRPNAAELAAVRRYNLALWRLANGKGPSPLEELAIVTGLSTASIQRRTWRTENLLSDEELTGQVGPLPDDDRRYLGMRYANSNDPDVKRWLTEIRDVERN